MDSDLLKIVFFVLALPTLLGITKLGAVLSRHRQPRDWSGSGSLITTRLASAEEPSDRLGSAEIVQDEWEDTSIQISPSTGEYSYLR